MSRTVHHNRHNAGHRFRSTLLASPRVISAVVLSLWLGSSSLANAQGTPTTPPRAVSPAAATSDLTDVPATALPRPQRAASPPTPVYPAPVAEPDRALPPAANHANPRDNTASDSGNLMIRFNITVFEIESRKLEQLGLEWSFSNGRVLSFSKAVPTPSDPTTDVSKLRVHGAGTSSIHPAVVHVVPTNSVTALMKRLKSIRDFKIISEPVLMTVSGQPASIVLQSGLERPAPVGPSDSSAVMTDMSVRVQSRPSSNAKLMTSIGVSFADTVARQRELKPRLPAAKRDPVHKRNFETAVLVSPTESVLMLLDSGVPDNQRTRLMVMTPRAVPRIAQPVSYATAGQPAATASQKAELSDGDQLRQQLELLFPSSQIEVHVIRDTVLLRGHASSREGMLEIVEIAEIFFPNVINSLQLGQPTARSTRIAPAHTPISVPGPPHLATRNWPVPNTTKTEDPGPRRPAYSSPVPAGHSELRELRDELRALRHDVRELIEVLDRQHHDEDHDSERNQSGTDTEDDRSLAASSAVASETVRFSTRVYPVADLVIPIPHAVEIEINRTAPKKNTETAQADFDSLIKLITSSIEPDSWDVNGGTGRVLPEETTLSLVISQTEDNQQQIVELLQQLRRLQEINVTLSNSVLEMANFDQAQIEKLQQLKSESPVILTPGEAERLMKTANSHPHSSVKAAPRVSVFNGQMATLRGIEIRGVGLEFSTTAITLGDRQRVRLATTVTGEGEPADPGSSHSAIVPNQYSLAIDVTDRVRGRTVPESPDPLATTAEDTSRFLLLVQPRIIVQEEEQLVNSKLPAAFDSGLGVRLQPIGRDSIRKAELAGRYDGALEVLEVSADSPAADAGLRPGDRILGLDKWETLSKEHLEFVLERLKARPDANQKIFILRDGHVMFGQLKMRRD